MQTDLEKLKEVLGEVGVEFYSNEENAKYHNRPQPIRLELRRSTKISVSGYVSLIFSPEGSLQHISTNNNLDD